MPSTQIRMSVSMSDDESKFDGPEDEGPEDEEEKERAWQEFEEEERQRLEFEEERQRQLNEIAERDSGESEEEEVDVFDRIKAKTDQLGDSSISQEDKERYQQELDTLFFEARKKTEEPIAEVEYDRDYNAYSFARAAAVLSLESSWIEIRLKIDSLIKKLATTSLAYDKIISLKNAIDTFEKDYVYLIINSIKPKTKNENEPFESKIFHRIIVDSPQLFADFFEVFIGDVTFTPSWPRLANIQKFRAYMLDLRDKKKKDVKNQKPHSPDFAVCNLANGMFLHKKPDGERGFLYQGYWQVEYMLTELRNYTEHWKKQDSKKFLRKQLGRTLEEPILGSESPGNFFILISILFLISYHFIDVMQTWVDTDIILKK